MKIRSDFVSNSSSSSYVFSINFKHYDFDLFVENVCMQCDENARLGEKPADPRLYADNRALLEYCLRYYELLHLGDVVVSRKREIYRRGYDAEGKKIADPVELEYTGFNMIKRDYIDNPQPDRYNTENAAARMISDDELEYEYDKTSSSITVTRHYMEDVIRNPWHSGSKTPEGRRKERVKRMLEVMDIVDKLDDNAWRSPYMSSTYSITLNTIMNTRDLIASGYRVNLEKWENLDAIEARLRAGETVFHIECGDAGEGEEDTRLFSVNGHYPFDGVPVENVGGNTY